MKVTLKNKEVEVLVNDRLLLTDGKTATVVGDFQEFVVVKTDEGIVKPIKPEDIVDFVQAVVKTANFLVRLWQIFFPAKK